MIWESEWPDWHRIDEYGTEETVDDGLGGRCLGVGWCPVTPPPWLVMAGRSGRWCQLLCFFLGFFFYLLKIHGDWWLAVNQLQWTFSNSERLVLFVAGGSEDPQVGRRIPQCFPKHYSCYDTDLTAEITDAPTS